MKLVKAAKEPGRRLIDTAGRSSAGVTVTDDTAMRLATVQACVRVISEDVGALPLNMYRRLPGGGKDRAAEHPLHTLLHDAPNPEMTAISFKQALMVNALLTGNAYAFIEFTGSGRVAALWPILSSLVDVYRNDRGDIRYRVQGCGDFSAGEILHIPGMGYDGVKGLSPIAYARQPIGLAMAAEEFGSTFFSNGTHLGGVLSLKDEISEEAYERTRQEFRAMFRGMNNAHGVPVLEGGATYTQVGVPPEDAQFIETRKYQRSEIAGLYRVPPHMIGDLDRATFSNIEHQDQAYLQRALLPWLVRWEQAIRMKLIAERERGKYFAEFNTGNFLRGDTISRMQSYATGVQCGVLTVNEARDKENLNPVKGGDELWKPLNMAPAAAAAQNARGGNIRAAAEAAVDGLQRGADTFNGGGTRRAAETRADAAQAARIDEIALESGVEAVRVYALRDAFSDWMQRQADDVLAIVDRAYSESRQSRAESKPAGKRSIRHLLEMLNDYYRQGDRYGADALKEAVAAGAFPGWSGLDTALDGMARGAWRVVAQELPDAEAPDEAWMRGFMKRYSNDMGARLTVANYNELSRALHRYGTLDDECRGALQGILGNWYQSWKAEDMARHEICMLTNEAKIAAYRKAGYASVWRTRGAKPCPICRRMDGVAVTTLKPPLHLGCACTVTRGEKRPGTPLQPWEKDGTIWGEDRIRDWIRSDACNKRVSVQKQNRHRVGTMEYERYRAEFAANGKFGPSRLRDDVTDEEIERFVRAYAGTGEVKHLRDGSVTEDIRDTQIRGIVVNRDTGAESQTRNARVHYAKTGVHVVPDYRTEEQKARH